MSTGLIISILLILPIAGGMIGFFFKKSSTSISLISMAGTLIVSLILLSSSRQIFVYQWDWLNEFRLGIMIDNTARILLVLVVFVSLLVHLFSQEYLKSDESSHRYFAKLGFFTSAMLGLLISDHLILFFIFWELVGVASYLLIGFWFKKDEVPKSAKTAFLVNRVADISLISGILILNANGSSLFLSTGVGSWLFLPSLLCVIGAFGKSAQLPFSGWLTKAMVGPTPVSALIHAATMVAAGVYLLTRMAPYLNEKVLLLSVVVGALTTLYGGLSALVQQDIKKVLAYSTISQLGYMVLGVGVGASQASLFHLWTHAFFKAGLFLGAGSVIHYLHQYAKAKNQKIDAQDLRIMGGVKSRLPWTFWTFLICGLALAGLPFFSGFMSKEGIILASWSWAEQMGTWAYLVPDIALITVLLTSLYIGRLILIVFFGKSRLSIESASFSYKEAYQITIPLMLLALGSLWFFYNLNPFVHNSWLDLYFGSLAGEKGLSATIIGLVLAIGGIVLSFFLFRPGAAGMLAFYETKGQELKPGILREGFYLTSVYQMVGIMAIKTGQVLQWTDKQILDRFLHSIAMANVVFAKALNIFDRLIVDGWVNFVALISAWLGRRFANMHGRDIKWQLIWLLLILIFTVALFTIL